MSVAAAESSTDTDVIVVGAGAAGAAAAYHLAARGRRVRLLEAGRLPRPKPCGGGMAASVQRLFPFDLTPAVDRVITKVRFTWCLEDPVMAELPGEAPFWIVRRSRLDEFLAEQAVACGADLLEATAVEAITREGNHWRVHTVRGSQLSARAVVIADGASSAFTHPLGLGSPQPRFASAVSVEVEGEVLEPDTAHFEFGLVRHGFSWAFPRKGGLSIGVGSFIGREPLEAEAVLARLLPSFGLPPGSGERQVCPLRVWDGHHRLHHEAGAVVVGDAASLVDPFLAEGLRPALLSGTRAAEALDRWLGGETKALAGYSDSLRTEWGQSMAWGRRIAQVFYRLPRVGYQLGVKRPTAPRRIAQILSGEMGYGDIAQRVIRRLMFSRGQG
ncbi:geranylgeranyl reductase family protein [Synechococcus sp. BSF8S]|uniref:geranylgeranyl reductase family protein n=1 Tax=Synechococcales TaxID=1890424 RepID=UPI001624DBB0|nr:geranylgeranyl reductase family protein [Synechococcus sp. BSF8S]MBC1263518.1 geranylgeranyl reductase family protein [Synechococcus sp. BSA11S]